MLASYIVKGLRRELRNAVAGVDVVGGMDTLIDTATRAEKRFGLTSSGSGRRRSKERKKKKLKEKHRKKSSDNNSDEDSESDSNMDSDTDSSSSSEDNSSGDLESEDEEDTRKKHKKKSSKKTKEKTKNGSVEKAVEKKLKEMGIQKESGIKVDHCEICVKDGHKTKDCWYNPNFRGTVPERI